MIICHKKTFSSSPIVPSHTQVTIQEIDFVKNGGDIRWLQGLQHVPQKILNLLVVNKMVAHQPWLLKPDHMKVGTWEVCVKAVHY